MNQSPDQTEAQVLVSLNQPLESRTLELPKLKPGQVLVDVSYSGVCHSQLHEVRGRRGPDAYLPHTLGHEGSGVVREVGSGVLKVRPGDHVVLTWIKGDGAEVSSAQYLGPQGIVNSGAISTFIKAAVVSENRVVKISPQMALREAALLGCAIPTGAGAVKNTGSLQHGETVAVFGAGGIGLSAILAASAAEASLIIAIDVSSEKLAHASRLGAHEVIDATADGVLDGIMKLTGGKGVDLAVEAAGRRDTMETAYRSVRVGGRCVITGNLSHSQMISIDPMDLIRGKRLVGCWGGDTSPDRDIPRYAELYMESKFPIDKLITHDYDFTETNRALLDLEAGLIGRAVVRMTA